MSQYLTLVLALALLIRCFMRRTQLRRTQQLALAGSQPWRKRHRKSPHHP